MPEKDPLSYTMMTWGWVYGISALGGVAGYIRKVRSGVVVRFSLTEAVGEVVISAFVGVVTFFACEYWQVPQVLSAAIIGVAAHMGSRAILAFETVAERAFQRWLGHKIDTGIK